MKFGSVACAKVIAQQPAHPNAYNFKQSCNGSSGPGWYKQCPLAEHAWGFDCPLIPAPHFIVDLPTLFAITVFLSAIGGLLLIFAWLQNRGTTALALWGIGYLIGASAAMLFGSPGLMPHWWSVCVANSFACGAYGMMWAGARSFEGRRVRVPLVGAGVAIWISAFQFESFAASPPAWIVLVSAIVGCYALLSARELWYARDRELISRWPTMALAVSQAGFLLLRIPFANTLAISVVRVSRMVRSSRCWLFSRCSPSSVCRFCVSPCPRSGPSLSRERQH